MSVRFYRWLSCAPLVAAAILSLVAFDASAQTVMTLPTANVPVVAALPAGSSVIAQNVGQSQAKCGIVGQTPAVTLAARSGWYQFPVGLGTQMSCTPLVGPSVVDLYGLSAGGTTLVAPVVVPTRTASSSPINVAASDYFVCASVPGAPAAVNLPASPATGRRVEIKDCLGQAAAQNITITPAAGDIDGSPTLVLSTNNAATILTYDGSQWEAK